MTNSSPFAKLFLIEQYISIYGPFCLTTLGIIGNILSILIFFSPRYRRQSSHFYLLSLALSDLCFLIINLVEDTSRNHNQLYQSRLNFLDRSSTLVCILAQYARNVTRSLSSWIIVSFTIERLLVVFYPLKRAIICRRKIARYVVLFLFLLILLNNLNVPFHYGITSVHHQLQNETICDVLPEYHSIYMRFAISTMISVYLLPMFLIGIVNTLICSKLWSKNVLVKEEEMINLARERDRLCRPQRSWNFLDCCSCLPLSSRSSSLSSNNSHKVSKMTRTPSISRYQSIGPLMTLEMAQRTGRSSSVDENHLHSSSTVSTPYLLQSKSSRCSVKTYIQSRTHRVTATLLLVSCSFLLLNSPYCVIWIANYVHRFENMTLKSLKEICELLMLMNFCINFLLYCVGGKAFRMELICLIRCRWKELYDRNEGERRIRHRSKPKIEIQINQSNIKSRSYSLYPQDQNHRLSITSYFNRIPTPSRTS